MREALEGVATITVREKSAQQVLEEAGVRREVIVTADPALLLKPEPLPRNILKIEGLEGRRHLIGMSVREPGVAAPDLDAGACAVQPSRLARVDASRSMIRGEPGASRHSPR